MGSEMCIRDSSGANSAVLYRNADDIRLDHDGVYFDADSDTLGSLANQYYYHINHIFLFRLFN